MKIHTYLKSLREITAITSFLFLMSCEKNTQIDEQTVDNTSNPSIEDITIESNPNPGKIVTISYQGQSIDVEKIQEQYLFEGDIVMISDKNSSGQQKSVGKTGDRWTDNIVYYTIDSGLEDQYRVYNAMDHWEANTNIRFSPKSDSNSDYVTFISGAGCSSFVGRIGGQQYVTLAPACSTGNAIHEIGHAIGLWHEQSRKDRDEYITIHYENIESGKEHNFQTYIERSLDGNEYSDNFDFTSIMMYSRTAFSSNGLPTISRNDGSSYTAQRDGLSEDDIAGVLRMYPNTPSNNDELVIKNPTFSIKDLYKDGSNSTCSCTDWYNPNFNREPGSSSDSNDDPGTMGGGSIKLNYDSSGQRVAYQLVDNVVPHTTYKLTFYYSIKNSGTIGELDFRVLSPDAINPSTVNSSNTIAQFIGEQTENTNSIKASNGGGQRVELEFTAQTNQIALYAVNSIMNGSDVRIDNFKIEKTSTVTIPEIKNPTFSIKDTYKEGSSSICSCVDWYNPDFLREPGSSADSNDDAGTMGGGSIKLTYDTSGQRVAYQLLDNLTVGTTYTLTFYYAIKNSGTIGELDFRILTPEATKPSLVTSANTITQFSGTQTTNTNSIKASNGGGQIVSIDFTPTTTQVALYAVNSVMNGSDVRIDNFSISIK